MHRWLASVLGVVGIVASATPVLGLLLWTLTATPLTATSGAETTFTLTATNLDLLTELGCLEVDLPPSFDIVAASAGNASNGDEWEAVVFPNKVAVHSLSGGGRLELGQSITFTIAAIPTQAGTWTWSNHAHRQQDCSGTDEVGVPLELLVLPGATPTPDPTPTPTPILSLEPLPTVPPIVPLPSIGLVTPAPTPRPPSPLPTPTPSPSATPSASPSASVAATPSGTGGAPSASAPAGSAPRALPLEVAEPGGSGGFGGPVDEVSLGPLSVVDGITVWAIPGAIVAGPGLLVILWVLLQTGAVLAWIPAVRRMRGKDGLRVDVATDPRRTVAP